MKDDMKIEMEAGRNIQLDHIKEIMKENIPDLLAENQRLKIKNNKMKRLLKDLDYWLGQELNLNYFKGEIMSFVLTKDYIMEEQKKKIEEVLKKSGGIRMSNFICEKCGMTNIDCGKQGYKTEREIELEKQLDREKRINKKLKSALEVYADHDNWYNSLEWNTYDKQGWETAEEALKEIEDME